MTDTDKENTQSSANADNKTGMSGGVILFRLLLLGAVGLFLYTANEGQDNMFEDFAEILESAKSKVTSIWKPSPANVASQIIQRELKSPESFKLQKSVLLWTGQTKNADPAYIVLLDYTAQNGLGGAVRDCHLVSFHQAENGQAKWSRKYGIQKLQTSTCRANLSGAQKNELANLFIKANDFKTD